MPATNLFHIAIKTGKPEATKRFYEQVFGMVESPRPPFEFPGYWMQLNTPHGGSIFHIYTGSAALGNDGRVPTGSGAIDHIALSAYGFGETRERCRSLGVPYRERSVPGFPLWQLFSYDPNGIQFELNFHSAFEERQGVAVDPNNFLKAGLEWFDPGAYRQFETA
jgi:catechol 2,3-dioxygenase-like lactoylglutathione lyase family enzyme